MQSIRQYNRRDSYGHRKVEVHPNIELTPYLSADPFIYKEHRITVRKQKQKTTTKVTSKCA